MNATARRTAEFVYTYVPVLGCQGGGRDFVLGGTTACAVRVANGMEVLCNRGFRVLRARGAGSEGVRAAGRGRAVGGASWKGSGARSCPRRRVVEGRRLAVVPPEARGRTSTGARSREGGWRSYRLRREDASQEARGRRGTVGPRTCGGARPYARKREVEGMGEEVVPSETRAHTSLRALWSGNGARSSLGGARSHFERLEVAPLEARAIGKTVGARATGGARAKGKRWELVPPTARGRREDGSWRRSLETVSSQRPVGSSTNQIRLGVSGRRQRSAVHCDSRSPSFPAFSLATGWLDIAGLALDGPLSRRAGKARGQAARLDKRLKCRRRR